MQTDQKLEAELIISPTIWTNTEHHLLVIDIQNLVALDPRLAQRHGTQRRVYMIKAENSLKRQTKIMCLSFRRYQNQDGTKTLKKILPISELRSLQNQ